MKKPAARPKRRTGYDAIVIGLGAMGSAALCQLAGSGARVLGLDRFTPPHPFGSSHGETRITRLAIGEGVHFTPLVKRSHALWREIERETSQTLLTQCGGLVISSANKTAATHVENFFANTVEAARRHGIAHELLDTAGLRWRFPAFRVREGEFGYFEPEAGFVRPEAAIRAQLALAGQYGADMRCGEAVMGFEAQPGGVSVTTGAGCYHGDRLVIAAGAWLPGLLGQHYARLFRVYRQVLYWFATTGDAGAFQPGRFPIFIWELPDARQGIYGFPSLDGAAIKIATEQYDAAILPEEKDHNVSEAEIAAMHRLHVAPYLDGVSARCTRTETCLYTVTPDAGFIIDRLPESPRVILASCCSGHGFKHSAAVGEILRDLALDRDPAFDLAPFRLARFS